MTRSHVETGVREGFDENHWITRLGSTLDEVASDSTIFSVGSVTGPALQIYSDTAHRRAYAALAERARSDPAAEREFQATHMRPNAEPLTANAIIREHPSLQNAFDQARSDESIEMLLPSMFGRLRLTQLVGNLAKVAVKEGGAEAAALLNRYLTWGDDIRLPAHEVILVHGLDVVDPVELGGDAFLASYEDARDRLHLPDDPEPWLDSASRAPLRLDSSSSLCALVRPIAWGPGVIDDRTPLPVDRDQQPVIRHSFPAPCEGIPERFFHDRTMLVDLLSIATGSRLVSHTAFITYPFWIRQLNPNFEQPPGAELGLFDVWPRDRPFTASDAPAFADLARGWLTYSRIQPSIDLSIRRVAASLGPAGGTFGLEDRILDVAISLEMMYTPLPMGKIVRKLRNRGERLLSSASDGAAAAHFYSKTRSDIVHGTSTADQRELSQALSEGRDLACRTLAALLDRGKPVTDWGRLDMG